MHFVDVREFGVKRVADVWPAIAPGGALAEPFADFLGGAGRLITCTVEEERGRSLYRFMRLADARRLHDELDAVLNTLDAG